jgi:hypothetical protein
MGSSEIKSADTAGTVENKAEQQLNRPTPKASAKASGSSGGSKAKRPTVNERGIPVQNWDVPENDPNLRKHVGEDPTGESNKLKKIPGE